MNSAIRSAMSIALACCSLSLPIAASAGGTAFSIGDASVIEGSGNLQFTVTASPAPAASTTVNFASSNGTAQAGPDYPTAAGTLTFGIGVATQLVTIVASNENTVEAGETVNVTLSNPGAGATLADALGIGTIENDDQTVVTLPDGEVDEGDAGSLPMDFALSLSNPVQGGVNIAFQTADGNNADPTLNATIADGDFASSSGSVGFPNLVVGPQPISISVLGDIKVEPDQAFRLSLSIGSVPVGVDPADVILPANAALGRILNDDGAVVSVGDIAIDEGNGGAVTLDFPITLSSPSKTSISVNYVAAAGSASASDFTAISGTFVIPPLTTSAVIAVPVISESLVEPDETVNLTLSAPSGGFLGDNAGVGTIRNDDSAVVGIANSSAVEGNAGPSPMTFAVTLSNPVQGIVGVSASSADGANPDPLLNATLADNDYQSNIAAPLNFASGSTAQNFVVQINGDQDVEPDQQLRVSLSNLSVPPELAAGSVSLAAVVTTGTIQTDDGTVLTIDDATVAEPAAGTVNLGFAINLSAPSKAPVTVDYQAIGQTAVVGTDFVADSGTFTIPSNVTTASLMVVVNSDNVVEGSETLRVLLANPQGVSIGDGDALGTITDDDVALLRLTGASASEQDGANLVLTATLSKPVAQAVSVQYASGDGTAIDGSDYTAVSGQITFPALATSASISVPLLNDTLTEGSETFSVALSNPTPGAPFVLLDQAVANGTIFDDDARVPVPAGTQAGWLMLIAAMAWLAGRSGRLLVCKSP